MTFDIRVIPDLRLLLMQIAATFILFLVLRHFLFKPVSKFLSDRRERIEKDLADAKNKREEALSLREEYELKIEEAKKEAHGILEAARKRGEEVRETIIGDAKKEAENMIQKASKEIERLKEKAIEELKTEVVSIAMMAATKVIDKNLDENTHREMINKFINEVGENKWQS